MLEKLLADGKKGDGKAVETLIERFKPLLSRQVGKFRGLERQEDLWQNAYLFFIEGISLYDPCRGVPFPAYIQKKVQYDFMTWLRRQRVYQNRIYLLDKPFAEIEGQFSLGEGGEGPDAMIAEEEREEMAAALAALSPRQREAVLATTIGGKSLAAVGKEMGISPQAVSKLRQRGIKTLKMNFRG